MCGQTPRVTPASFCPSCVSAGVCVCHAPTAWYFTLYVPSGFIQLCGFLAQSLHGPAPLVHVPLVGTWQSPLPPVELEHKERVSQAFTFPCRLASVPPPLPVLCGLSPVSWVPCPRCDACVPSQASVPFTILTLRPSLDRELSFSGSGTILETVLKSLWMVPKTQSGVAKP